MEKKNVKTVGLGDGHSLTGARISMKDVKRVSFVCLVAAGSTETAFQVDIQQHDAASAGTSKALSVSNKYYHKIAAATQFTQVEPSVAASAYDLQSDLGDDVAVLVFEVLAENVDEANGFDWVSVDISGAGASTRTVAIAGLIDDNFKPSYGNDI